MTVAEKSLKPINIKRIQPNNLNLIYFKFVIMERPPKILVKLLKYSISLVSIDKLMLSAIRDINSANPAFYSRIQKHVLRISAHCLATFFGVRERASIYYHSLDRFIGLFKDIPCSTSKQICVWNREIEGQKLSIQIQMSGFPSVCEGAVLLEAYVDTTLIHRLTFSVIPEGMRFFSGEAILIGGNQGYGTENTRRLFAKHFYEINSDRALLAAIKATSRALGIKEIYGVKAMYHPQKFIFDKMHIGPYDQFWRNNHGEEQNIFFLLSASSSEGQMTKPKGSHKGRKIKKREQLSELTENVFANLLSHMNTSGNGG